MKRSSDSKRARRGTGSCWTKPSFTPHRYCAVVFHPALFTPVRLGAIELKHRVVMAPLNGGQVALAWLLHHSPVILPIPGTLRVAHLEENVAAAALSLAPEAIAELDAAASTRAVLD